MVKTSADSLLAIINDILDFSKIEAGKMALDPIPFRLRDSSGRHGEDRGRSRPQKGLELACHVPPDVPDALIGDTGRLRQIIVNLAGNAIKFTEHGRSRCLRSAREARTPPEPTGRNLPAFCRLRYRHRHSRRKAAHDL